MSLTVRTGTPYAPQSTGAEGDAIHTAPPQQAEPLNETAAPALNSTSIAAPTWPPQQPAPAPLPQVNTPPARAPLPATEPYTPPSLSPAEALSRTQVAQYAQGVVVMIGGTPWEVSIEPLTHGATMEPAPTDWRVHIEWGGAPYELDVPAAAAHEWLRARFPTLDV